MWQPEGEDEAGEVLPSTDDWMDQPWFDVPLPEALKDIDWSLELFSYIDESKVNIPLDNVSQDAGEMVSSNDQVSRQVNQTYTKGASISRPRRGSLHGTDQLSGDNQDGLGHGNTVVNQVENNHDISNSIQTDDVAGMTGEADPFAYTGNSKQLQIDTSGLEEFRGMFSNLSKRLSLVPETVSPPGGGSQPQLDPWIISSRLEDSLGIESHVGFGSQNLLFGDFPLDLDNPDDRPSVTGCHTLERHQHGSGASSSCPKILTPSGTPSSLGGHTYPRLQASSGSSSPCPKILTPSGTTSSFGSQTQSRLQTDSQSPSPHPKILNLSGGALLHDQGRPSSSQGAMRNRFQQVLELSECVVTESDKTQDPEVQLEPRTKSKARKRRYASEELEKVNSVRASSACIRCQVMKDACSEDTSPGPCDRCVSIESSKRIWEVPCFRGQLTSAIFFRTVALRFPNGSKQTTQWHGRDKRQVEMFFPPSHGLDYSSAPSIFLECRKFRPTPAEVLKKSYPTPEGPRILKLPPYTLIKLPNARKTMENFATSNFDFLFPNLKTDTVGTLFSETFDEAKRFSSNSAMLLGALHVAILTRLASKSFAIRGEEDLNIPCDQHPLSPYSGRKPVPVMVDREMFLTWLSLMTRKQKSVLAELKRKIFQRERRLWFEIFLTVFVLMSNLEFCYQHQVRKLKLHQDAAELGEIIISGPTEEMLDKWRFSAENLVAHFAVICQGYQPFTLDWSLGKNSDDAGLDARSTQYMLALTKKLNSTTC